MMKNGIRPVPLSATALLAAMLASSPVAADPQAPASATYPQVKAAYDSLVRCGETAIAAKGGARPQSLKEAKSVLGVNCMPEFNDFMLLADSFNQRHAPIEEANHQLGFAASELLTPPSAQAMAPDRRADEPVSAANVPANCGGSVKKGMKAFNAGDYDLALCHWLPKARAGDPAAQNNMGLLFDRGLSNHTPQNDAEAAAWYHLAAQQGVPLAMRNLAQVQIRTGNEEAGRSWLEMADATELQQRAVREQRRAQAVALIAGGLACALGACPTVPSIDLARTGFGSQGSAGVGYSPATSSGRNRISSGDFGAGSSRTGAGTDSARLRMCADGSYVSGTCRMAPDGSYVGGTPRMAPDGTYASGTPRMAPDGSYVGGTGRMIMCPDGTYVAGTRCRLAPNGKYVGQ